MMQTGEIYCTNPAGLHRMVYTEHGAQHKHRHEPVVVCVHGLTRNGRDFDRLGEYLAEHESRYVICPDIVGRGQSDWLASPELYTYTQYIADMNVLINAISPTRPVDWVGTSMGGIMGMMMAVQPNQPIRRLVLNDVGPFIPKEALQRLAQYVGKDPHFENMPEFEAYLKLILAPFGLTKEDDWRALSCTSARVLPDGKLALAYDPTIGEAFNSRDLMSQFITDLDFWPLWEGIRAEVFTLRGAVSDLLLPETAKKMTETGPRSGLKVFEGCGHAPSLMVLEQIHAVNHFLNKEPRGFS